MSSNKPIRQKHGQTESIFGALEVAPGVFLGHVSWSRKMPGPFFLHVHNSPSGPYNYAGTRPCPLTYKRTCPEQAGRSTEGERSYHFETGVKEVSVTAAITHKHKQPMGW